MILIFTLYGYYLQTMSHNSTNQILEPRLSEDVNREKIVRNLLIDKPEIKKFERSSVLDQVKSFLPQMADAESKLSEALAAQGSAKFNVENISGEDNVIEMDLALMKNNMMVSPPRNWTSDSEDDSSPSLSENSFTSDTDISSSSTCSSSSCDESPAISKSQR